MNNPQLIIFRPHKENNNVDLCCRADSLCLVGHILALELICDKQPIYVRPWDKDCFNLNNCFMLEYPIQTTNGFKSLRRFQINFGKRIPILNTLIVERGEGVIERINRTRKAIPPLRSERSQYRIKDDTLFMKDCLFIKDWLTDIAVNLTCSRINQRELSKEISNLLNKIK